MRKKLDDALTLKDYAINANLDVDDDIIEKLNKASKSLSLEHASDIDKALRDLTSITYPTTIETLRASRGSGGEAARKMMFWLLIIAPVVLLVALVAVWQEQAGKYPILWQSLIALCLGMLGSVVYIFFNLIGVIPISVLEQGSRLLSAYRTHADETLSKDLLLLHTHPICVAVLCAFLTGRAILQTEDWMNLPVVLSL